MKYALTLAALLCAAPAYAETTDSSVTLLIENDAGMVTQVANMTVRECDAAVLLLSTRRSPSYGSTGATVSWSYSASLNQPYRAPAPTSRLTSARCVSMLPDDKK